MAAGEGTLSGGELEAFVRERSGASRLELLIRQLQGKVAPVAARVYHNTTQSIPNGVTTALVFNSERYDDVPAGLSEQHSVSTNTSRLTCRIAGLYHIEGALVFTGNATGVRSAGVRLNGSTPIVWDEMGANASSLGQTVSTEYRLAVGDYVELVAFQNSGGALNVVNVANYSPEFMWHRVSD